MSNDPQPTELAARYAPPLRAECEELLRDSAASTGDRQPVALDQQSVGRLSRMDALQGQAMAVGMEARRRARIRAIEAALGRLDSGEFGWCDACGEFIGYRRLDIDPCATRCFACASGAT